VTDEQIEQKQENFDDYMSRIVEWASRFKTEYKEFEGYMKVKEAIDEGKEMSV